MELVIAKKELELFATGKHQHPQHLAELLTDATGAAAAKAPSSANPPSRNFEKFDQRSFEVQATRPVRIPVAESSYDPVPVYTEQAQSVNAVTAVNHSESLSLIHATTTNTNPSAPSPESGKSCFVINCFYLPFLPFCLFGN